MTPLIFMLYIVTYYMILHLLTHIFPLIYHQTSNYNEVNLQQIINRITQLILRT